MLTKPPILDATGQKILTGINRIKNALLGTTSDSVTPGSAGSSGTEPVFQDDTGRDIITALNDLGTAVKPASATDNGYVSTGSQTIAGEKTFTSPVILKTAGSTAAGPAALDYLYGNNTNGIRVFAGRTYSSGKVYTTRLKIQQYSYDSTSKANISTSQTYNLPLVPADLAADEDYNIITTNNLTDIPDASASVRGMVSTGTQTFAGTKTFNTELKIAHPLSSGGYLRFCDTDGNESAYFRDRTSSTHRLDFIKRSYNSANDSLLSTYESYMLPVVDADRTASADYNILTSKTISIAAEKNYTALAANAVRTYTFEAGSRGFFWFNGASSTGAQGFYLFNITTQGGVTVREIAAASFVTVTTASNQIIFTKSSLNTAVYPSFLLTNGSITSVVTS